MATITFERGFKRTPAQEAELRNAAVALPADWRIEVAGLNGAGRCSVRVFRPRLGNLHQEFAPDDVLAAIRLLEFLNR